jgi:hypothetical protein
MKKITVVAARIITSCLALVLVTLPFIWRYSYLKSTETSVLFTVEKAERVTDRTGQDSKYLIFTKNETFEITDEIFYQKFNSSDIYGALKPNHHYKAKVIGSRNPTWSWYRNIISVQEVSQ